METKAKPTVQDEGWESHCSLPGAAGVSGDLVIVSAEEGSELFSLREV